MLWPGLAALMIAILSIADMFLPRPYDGVVLEADAPGRRVVRGVVPGSGADEAGIRAGDIIVGIDRVVLDSTVHAQTLLNRHDIGERVSYLVRSGDTVDEVSVELGRRQIGDVSYLIACLLGFLFFGVGLFVVLRQPRMRASRVFFTMCVLFLLFLVCRLRPASYSWVDVLVLTTGTFALLFLPAAFLHFFLIFPRPIWEWRRDPIAVAFRWFAERWRMAPVYLVPFLVYAAVVTVARRTGGSVALISGAPAANWWVMGVYMVLGLGALGLSAAYLDEPRQRRGAGLVFLGTLLGVVPFIVLTVAFPSFLHTERFVFYGIVPLILVPMTFALAIVRFQLLDIRVILRKSLLYTVTTALVTALYALGIAFFNLLFRGTRLAESPWFPVVFALAIVLLFEPLRHRVQGPVDRFFFAERLQLQQAMVEMGEAMTTEPRLDRVVAQLVERLPQKLGLYFAGLYLLIDGELRREAGPETLPGSLFMPPSVLRHLVQRGPLLRVTDLAPLELVSTDVESASRTLAAAGVEMVGLLASRRRTVGLVVLSTTVSQTTWEVEETQLLQGLLQQASIALETGLLLEERTRQAELERELSIAASIQSSLLPRRLPASDGWRLAAVCRPAREVGGDFYAELPRTDRQERAFAYGDVSGKSISGALMMMAAHEVLNALAIAHPDPEELLRLANQRLRQLRERRRTVGGSFVALGYLALPPGGGRVRYALAGQPPPLVRRSGTVEELPLPPHRVPLGALRTGGHRLLDADLAPGDLLLAYSDGVVDARSPEGEQFGDERLARALATSPGDPDEVVCHLLDELTRFTRDEPAYDDVTLLAVMRTPIGG